MNTRYILPALAVLALARPLWAQAPPLPEPLTLAAAGQYALAHNPDLLAMAQEVQMAQANLRLARSDGNLQASVNAYAAVATTANMITSPPEVMPDDMRMMDTGRTLAADVRLRQTLANGGRVRAQVNQRRRLLNATEADLAAARLQLVYDTRTAYRAVLLRQKLLDVRQKAVDALEELVRVDAVKLEAGKIPLYYLLRDKTRLAEAQQELANGQRDVEVGMFDLSVLLGLDRPRQLTLTDSLAFVPTEPGSDDALQTAAAQRPELAAARARIEAALAGVTVARAAYQPQLAATVIFDVMTGSDIMSDGGYTAALVASLPLADGGSRRAEVAMAQARHQQLLEQERRQAQAVARDVLTAQANLRAADRNIRTSLEAQAAAEEDYRVARVRYDAGKAINLEPLDALAAWVQARVNAAQALYEFNNARDDLQRVGGTMPPATDPAPAVQP